MIRRRLAFALLPAALAGSIAVSHAQPPHPSSGIQGHLRPGGPPPVHPEEIERVAEFLDSQGRTDLAGQLRRTRFDVHPMDRQEDAQGQRGPGFGRSESERDSETKGRSSWRGFEFAARAREAHVALLRIEERSRRIADAETELSVAEEGKTLSEDEIRQRRQRIQAARGDLDAYVAEWAKAAREDIPEVRRRIAEARDRLRRATSDRSAPSRFLSEAASRMDEFEAFLAAPPEEDEQLLEGLREHLDHFARLAPEGLRFGQPQAHLRRADRVEREILLLRRRLAELESELATLNEGTDGDSDANGEEWSDAPLPPLPPDW